MAVLVRNVLPNMSREQYKELSSQVMPAVQAASGFQVHVGFPAPDGQGWAVSEVWDTEDDGRANFESNVMPHFPQGAEVGMSSQVIDDVTIFVARRPTSA